MDDSDDADDATPCACLLECECPGRAALGAVHPVGRGGLSQAGIELLGLTVADVEEP